MHHNKIQLAVLSLLITTGFAVYAQCSSSGTTSVAPKVAGPPTARNLAYPQSLFVDSDNGNIWVADFDNNRILRFDVLSLTSVRESIDSPTAEDYKLGQNYPNPFNPSTTITFAMRNTEHATVAVYDLLGQEVATLFDGVATAHRLYSLSFDARNLPSGVYFYTLRSPSRNEVRKMGLLK